MALRQAGASVLSGWHTRLGGAINQQLGASGLIHTGSSSDDEGQRDTFSEVRAFASTPAASQLVGQQAVLQPNTRSKGLPFLSLGLQSSPALISARGLMTRAARVGGLSPMGLGPATAGTSALAAMHQGQQVRSINAWSPAQRYFVEGDHVITAEANRTIQFTGLDAGSFYPFVIYTAFATAVAAVFILVPFLVAPTRVDLDKSSAYECGFDAFGEARQTFSVSFYLVSIMYLLFDIEIAYLFPYVMTHANAPMFWTMNLFLGILVAGFVYEWGVGALEWRESKGH